MLTEEIRGYVPYNEQEEKDREFILKRMEEYGPEKLLTRDNEMFHFTCASWIVNPDRTKVLLVYHNIYDSWSWTGGHADGEANLLRKAMEEAKEETGVKNIHPVLEDIFSLEVLTVDGHRKKGKYLSSHLHLNVTYLLEADENDILSIKEDENSGVGWFSIDEVPEVSTEPWMVERVYSKLNEKLAMLREVI